MKKLSLILASLFVSSMAFAGQTEVTCTRRFSRPGSPVVGQTLVISKEGNSYKGLLFANCPQCRVVPTELNFQNKEYRGMQLIYSGRGASLTISLESLVATKTHPGQLFIIGMNDSKPMGFSCTSGN